MKHSLFLAAALSCTAFLSLAGDDSRDCLLRLFNARLAENPRRFAEAARMVADEAADGGVLHQYAIVLVLDDPSFPADVASRLDDATRGHYAANRSRIEYFAKNKGNAFAWYMLALSTTNAESRVSCLRHAAAGNNEQALNELGVGRVNACRDALAAAYENLRLMRERGAPADEQDAARREADRARSRLDAARKEAVGYFRRAADKSDSNGRCNLASCLLYGYGCDKDAAKALELLKSAAKDGHPQAMSMLGECYRDGVGCARDLAAAAASFKQSAGLGNASGQYNYALALLSGDGVEKDEKYAVELLKKAAMRRLVEAMDAYAKCLLDATGCRIPTTDGLVGEELARVSEANAVEAARRDHEAVSWLYVCAKELSYPPSMVRLADCFRDGRGVGENGSAAVYWYCRAAMDFGDTAAMIALADCCEKGIGGLKKSHEDALWWRTKARATEGDRCAKIWLSGNDPGRFDDLFKKGGRR